MYYQKTARGSWLNVRRKASLKLASLKRARKAFYREARGHCWSPYDEQIAEQERILQLALDELAKLPQPKRMPSVDLDFSALL